MKRLLTFWELLGKPCVASCAIIKVGIKISELYKNMYLTEYTHMNKRPGSDGAQCVKVNLRNTEAETVVKDECEHLLIFTLKLNNFEHL